VEDQMATLINRHTSEMPDRGVRIALGRAHMIPRGQGRCFSIGRFRVAVFRQRDDSFFALENACPHQGGPLADGVIGAGMVVCPLHAHRFKLADGSGMDTELCARSFPVEIRDGTIFVQIAADA
jgi:nitrite reductase [NAD(P)H] small subunit